MLRLALILSALAFPASAQTPCGGIPDVMAELYAAGFHAVNEGQADGGTFTVFTEPGGRFVVIYMNAEVACLVADGTDWGEAKPDA